MGIIETKIVQVNNNPATINRSNEEWGSFGWNVLSVQVTHSQDTKTYSKGMDYYTGDRTVETTTINYATITYQRDKSMPNYSRIVELENEYRRLDDEGQELFARRGKPSLLVIIMMVILWPIGLAYLAYRIFLAVMDVVKGPEKKKKAHELVEKMEQIQEQAAALL